MLYEQRHQKILKFLVHRFNRVDAPRIVKDSKTFGKGQ